MDLINFGDGICDDELNNEKNNFDSGDCCENNTVSRSSCDVCLCNVKIMETLRTQNGYECHRKKAISLWAKYGAPEGAKPSNGYCDPSKQY